MGWTAPGPEPAKRTESAGRGVSARWAPRPLDGKAGPRLRSVNVGRQGLDGGKAPVTSVFQVTSEHDWPAPDVRKLDDRSVRGAQPNFWKRGLLSDTISC